MLPWAGDHLPKLNTEDEESARNWSVYLASKGESINTQRHLIMGAYYKNIFPGYALINPKANDYDLELDIAGGKTTTLYIRSAANRPSLLQAAMNLGNKVLECSSLGKLSSVCNGDFGQMHALGYRNSATGLQYKGTDFCKDALTRYLEEAGPYLEETLPFVRQDIEEAEMLKMGRTPRCQAFDTQVPVGNTANISINLGNPSHFDCNDASLCWAHKIEGERLDKLKHAIVSLSKAWREVFDTANVFLKLHHIEFHVWIFITVNQMYGRLSEEGFEGCHPLINDVQKILSGMVSTQQRVKTFGRRMNAKSDDRIQAVIDDVKTRRKVRNAERTI